MNYTDKHDNNTSHMPMLGRVSKALQKVRTAIPSEKLRRTPRSTLQTKPRGETVFVHACKQTCKMWVAVVAILTQDTYIVCRQDMYCVCRQDMCCVCRQDICCVCSQDICCVSRQDICGLPRHPNSVIRSCLQTVLVFETNQLCVFF